MRAEAVRVSDPILLEVFWNRLVSVCNEQAAALMRTSFTTIVRESEDLSAGVFDRRGNMIAQSVTGTPGHINSMATSMRHFLNRYPIETLEPGDVLITNDPWYTSGQLHDLTIMTPAFRRGEVVAFFGNTCHAADIGGRGLSADGREIYEEGLYVPIVKLFRRGEPNQDVLDIIRGNVRSPDMVLGDIHAQVACNEVGCRRLLEFLGEFGFDSIEPLADEIIEVSERAMRAAIQRIPNGIYTSETWSDGFAHDEPIRIACTITIDGSNMLVDYTGSSPQNRLGVNVVLNYTTAYTTFGIKASISPEVPNNEGSFRPVRVTAPEGCILNAVRPAALAARHIVGHLAPVALFGALAQVIPERVMAEGSAAIWITQTRGFDLKGRPFTFFQTSAGGTGARPGQDGLDNTSFPSGVAGVPAEVIESLTPLVIHERSIRPDSAGAGRFRGGLGQSMRIGIRSKTPWTIAALFDRIRFSPAGYCGGKAGARGDFMLSDGSRPDPKIQQTLDPGVEVRMQLPGGGGFWPPFERCPDAVLRDVVEGKVSIAAAEREYGLVIVCSTPAEDAIRLPGDYEIDRAATVALRERLAAVLAPSSAAQE
ncbi:MAG: hydantoinase B/oxoprolinase family protein [Vicinamibacterales bacterium]